MSQNEISFKPTLELKLNSKVKKLIGLSNKLAELKYKCNENRKILIKCNFCWDNIEKDLKNILTNIEEWQNKKENYIEDILNNRIKSDLKYTINKYEAIINNLKEEKENLLNGINFDTCSNRHNKIQKKLKKWLLLIREYQNIFNKININEKD